MAQPMLASRQPADLTTAAATAGVAGPSSSHLVPGCAFDAAHPVASTSAGTTAHHAPTTHVIVPAPPPFTVLIVDDNAINRRMLQFPLSKAGISCVEAADGLEAVQMFALHAPDLVLMDITMPVMDGFQASFEIRQLEHFAAAEQDEHSGSSMAGRARRNCRIVATTSLQSEADLRHGQEAGMDDWLVKPIKPAKLVADVKAFQQMLAVEAAIPS
ncbi:uncharacterized protein PFL1_05248 [Pseudozyma flocculosa PF-1]|uniref:Response regulatory domain-containing protein n=2 Tax=Pseudozyma flocculosa TaxID=84751 RepID=A0A5C3F8H9_9BASI|nr:uncharacterized protein PFL1_05248 [Pseudozyma flocculosa PF-1]EPQ27326.1 hypothetical protein PFL1_05248 [Pseudozyma flocculosa PF-1]SPO39699.1 uncharacterized protein PSFLO_05180 [Pseudozyma flocculosa]